MENFELEASAQYIANQERFGVRVLDRKEQPPWGAVSKNKKLNTAVSMVAEKGVRQNGLLDIIDYVILLPRLRSDEYSGV